MNEGIRIFEKEITTRENKYPAFKAGDTISILCEYEDGAKKQQQILLSFIERDALFAHLTTPNDMTLTLIS